MEAVVSRLVRVRQGKTIVQFELSDKGLTIEYYPKVNQPPTRVTIKEPAIEVLVTLLNSRSPIVPKDVPMERPAGSIPKEGLPEGNGLRREADGTETGMD